MFVADLIVIVVRVFLIRLIVRLISHHGVEGILIIESR